MFGLFLFCASENQFFWFSDNFHSVTIFQSLGNHKKRGPRLARESRLSTQTNAEGEVRTRIKTRAVQRLVHALHDGQRTQPSPVTKQNNEDRSIRLTIAMEYYLMKMKSLVNAQTMSEESGTCIAVNEDRHQNIMSSVPLKQGVGETIDN